MDEDDSWPRSLFVVVFYFNEVTQQFSILQLESPEEDGHIEFIAAPEGPLCEDVVCFKEADELLPTKWSVCPPTITSTGEVYLFPGWISRKPLQGFNFNFTTASFQNIRLPRSMESHGETECLVNHRGKLYRIERLDRRSLSNSLAAESIFECYVPEKNSWTPLKPIPELSYNYRVTGTAVWGDNILFNVESNGIWAYDVLGDEWYDVDINDVRCFTILGEAVVLGSTIYALTELGFGLVLALSIKKVASAGNLVIKSSVSSVISVPDLIQMFPPLGNQQSPYKDTSATTTHLVHLGKRNFCIVQSCDPSFPNDHIPIHVTYMSLAGNTKMKVTAARMFKARHESSSKVVLCFSLPKCKTAALEEGKPFLKEVDPYTGEGHYSICVGDYPFEVNYFELVKEVKKFGEIKRNGIQVMRSETEGKVMAYVEYKSLSSKQRAIKAKTVRLGGCRAKISEKA